MLQPMRRWPCLQPHRQKRLRHLHRTDPTDELKTRKGRAHAGAPLFVVLKSASVETDFGPAVLRLFHVVAGLNLEFGFALADG